MRLLVEGQGLKDGKMKERGKEIRVRQGKGIDEGMYMGCGGGQRARVRLKKRDSKSTQQKR